MCEIFLAENRCKKLSVKICEASSGGSNTTENLPVISNMVRHLELGYCCMKNMSSSSTCIQTY